MSGPSRAFDPAPAARVLVEASRTGTLLPELSEPIRPRTMAEGYDIQDRVVAALGHPVAGWKLGLGSPLQKRRSGVGRAVAGRILGPHLHRDGDVITLPNAAPVTVEFEIAYVLGRDVSPDEASFDIRDVVAEVRVAFELVLSRFVDRRAVGWPSFAADNAGFQALVLGEAIPADRVAAVADSLVVDFDGAARARALTGEEATDPEAALADLVAIAGERSMVLPRGSVISTGTVSEPFDVAAPCSVIRARFLDRELGFTLLAPDAEGSGTQRGSRHVAG